jgi:hypothetical protein
MRISKRSKTIWILPQQELAQVNSFLLFLATFPVILTSLLFQNIIKHSLSKDHYIWVALKRLTKAHILEDELTEVSALNKVLLARNQELETQLADESQEKSGKYLLIFLQF